MDDLHNDSSLALDDELGELDLGELDLDLDAGEAMEFSSEDGEDGGDEMDMSFGQDPGQDQDLLENPVPVGRLQVTEIDEDEADDLEPVALSEEELESILGDTDGGGVLSASVDDEAGMGAGGFGGDDEPELTDADLRLDETELNLEDENELGALPELGIDDLSEDDLPLPDELSSELDTPIELGGEPTEMDGITITPAADSSSIPSILDDDGDDGPVTLSEDELGSILDDVEPTDEVFEEGEAPPSEMEISGLDMDSGFEVGGHDLMDMSIDASGGDEEITLSDEELSSVLLDTEDLPAAGMAEGETGVIETVIDFGDDETMSAPRLSTLDMEDDEPITLTAEELGNIVSDVDEEAAGDLPVGFSSELDDMDGDMGLADAPISILDEDGDEGPLALSENELDAILEDVDEESAVEALGEGAPDASRENVIVLDDYEDESAFGAALAEQPVAPVREDSAFMADAAAAANLDKDELRKMIGYLDQLFDRLPDETVREFSRSEYFDLYKKIMSELGL